jgi:Protein of unknown function (DUF3768)
LTYTPASKIERIRQLNDDFRQSFIGGRVVVTPGIRSLPLETNAAVLERVRTFADFNDENDPHGEHDFGAIEVEGETYFFKIDYYAPDMQSRSDDPANSTKTVRVLTIMRADEY